jgi:activator of 2-hydroxyglutaryl-CoA dehydratase
MAALQYTIVQQDITNYANTTVAALVGLVGGYIVNKELQIALDPLIDKSLVAPEEAYT